MTSSTKQIPDIDRKETVDALSPIQADYLEIIYEEFLVNGTARGCTIAATANVTHSTVTAMLRTLKAQGYIRYDLYGPILLTDKGKAYAEQLLDRRKTIEGFFKDIFGTDPVVARKLANINKHGAPEKMIRSLRRLTAFINAHKEEWLKWDPEGDC